MDKIDNINSLVMYLTTDSGTCFRQVELEVRKQLEDGILPEFIFVRLLNACNLLVIQKDWNIGEGLGRIANILRLYNEDEVRVKKLSEQIQAYVLSSAKKIRGAGLNAK